jgi:amidase
MSTDSIEDSIHFASLLELARLIESRQLSPVEVTRYMLDRIEAVDGKLKSYATVMVDRAIEAARKAEQEIADGTYRGPLHGVPVAVKDLCFTTGTRTMGGTGVFKDFLPAYDGTVVSRLQRAGAVLLGKLNLTEGAMAGYHPDFAIPVNPWNSNYWSGVSSSGSGVATAAGLCFASIGTDTGGSIRFPSIANGVVGLKPTYGRVSRYGVQALAESMDHVGTLARRVADAAVVLQAIAGWDEHDQTSLRDPVPDMLAPLRSGVRGLRLGVDRRFCDEGSDPHLMAAIEHALAVWTRLGAEIVNVEMPAGANGLREAWFAICAAEAARAHSATFPSRAAEYGPYFRDFLGFGVSITRDQYETASDLRRSFSKAFHEALALVDAIVCPSGGCTFPVMVAEQYGDLAALMPQADLVQMQFTVPANFAGTPTLTLPCGLSPSGVPYALQLLGRRLSEPMLCRIGHAYEEATVWHKRHPPA